MPEHAVYPAAQAHALFTHCSLAPHRVPQSPQLVLSFVRFTHVLLQRVSPSEQAAEHAEMPFSVLQTSPPVQAFPHAPQFWALVVRFTQAVVVIPPGPPGPPPPPPVSVQSVVPVAHWQAPAVHVAPAGQALPHEPQLAWLVFVSTQAVTVMPPRPVSVHAVSPLAHPAVQTPAVQV